MLDFPSPATTGQIFSNWQFDGAKWKQVGSLPPLPITDTGRNYVTNGTFVVAQRGAGPWTTYTYTADRWASFPTNGTQSTSIVALNDANRSAIGNETAAFGLQSVVAGSATAGSSNSLYQPIESVRRLAGKTVTLSFWAWAASGAPKVGASFNQAFASSSGGSAAVNGTGQSVTISTTPARYSLTFAIPSMAGKVLGTGGDDCTTMLLWLSGATDQNAASGSVGVQSGTFTFWGVQLEIGTQATALDAGGTPQQILAECQRFYQLYPGWQDTTANGSAGGTSVLVHALVTTMRAAPTATFSNVSYGNANTLTMEATNPMWMRLNYKLTSAGFGFAAADITLSADL